MSDAAPETEFGYRVRLRKVWLWLIFCAAGGIVFTLHAAANDRALVLNGIFLPPEAATAFYAFVGLGALAADAIIVYYLCRAQRVLCTFDSLTLPKSRWSCAEIAIPLASLCGVHEVPGSNPFVVVVHRAGFVTLYSSRFASPAAYAEVKQLLSVRMADAKRTTPI